MVRARTLCVLGLAGCSGATFQAGVYRDPTQAFAVGALPATWQRFDLARGSVAFHNAAGGAIVASCRTPARGVPLDVLANQETMGLVRRQEQERSRTRLGGREALRLRLSAELDGRPIALDLIVVAPGASGRVCDLALAAPPARLAKDEPDFERFSAAFREFGGAG